MDFQFLRDCVTALKTVQTQHRFSMNTLFYDGWPIRSDPNSHRPCGTPACVIGHYVAYKGLGHDFDSQMLEGHRILGLNGGVISKLQSEIEDMVIHGLTYAQREKLFGENGCGDAQTKEQAIAYIENFIVKHGGSLEDPKPLVVYALPEWTAVAEGYEEVTKEPVCPLT